MISDSSVSSSAVIAPTPPASGVRHAEPVLISELFARAEAPSRQGIRDDASRADRAPQQSLQPSPGCIGKFVRVLGQLDTIDAPRRRVAISHRGASLEVDIALLPLGETLRVGATVEFFGEICRSADLDVLSQQEASEGEEDPSQRSQDEPMESEYNNASRPIMNSSPSIASSSSSSTTAGSGDIALRARLCRNVDGVDLLLYEKTVRIARKFMNEVMQAQGPDK